MSSRLSPALDARFTADTVRRLRERLGATTAADFLAADPAAAAAAAAPTLDARQAAGLRDTLLRRFLPRAAPEAAAAAAETGLDVLLRCSPPLSSGSPALDGALAGGFRAGNIYEVFGPPGAGKTQLCLCAAAAAAGDAAAVVYIDTKNDLVVDRVVSALRCSRGRGRPIATDDDFKRALANVRVYKSFSLADLLATLAAIGREWSAAEAHARLLVLDNIASPVLAHLKQDNMSETFGFVSHAIFLLRRIAAECGVAVVVVNNAALGPPAAAAATARPALGKIFSDAADARVLLQAADPGAALAGVRRARVMHAPRRKIADGRAQHGKCEFTIGPGGFEN